MKGLVGGPLSVGGLGPRPSAPPPLNLALGLQIHQDMQRIPVHKEPFMVTGTF